jgi:sulfonate transport system substrate-binding protein
VGDATVADIAASIITRITMRRRTLLATAALATPAILTASRHPAFAASKGTLKIGYSKSSVTLVLAHSTGAFEKKLEPLGYNVAWAEFTSGPPMFEALNAGAVNFGFSGEPPVIFAQASHVPVVYAAASDPSPNAVAILTPAHSKIKTIADLAGKTVAVGKGTSAHYLLVAALAHAGVPYSAVNKAFLQPDDALAAFGAGDVDAWSIFDPYYAGAQIAGAKVLTDGTGLMPNRAYYSSRRDFAAASPDALNAAIGVINQLEAWEQQNIAKTAADVAPSIGEPTADIEKWFSRQRYGVHKITPDIMAGQQKIADAFFKLGLIPHAVNVADAAWSS